MTKNHAEHIKAVGNDEFDISFLGGMSYVVVTKRYGKKPIVGRFEFDGKPILHSVIIVNKDSNMTNIHDLKGKKVAFGDKDSTLSSQVPLYMLK